MSMHARSVGCIGDRWALGGTLAMVAFSGAATSGCTGKDPYNPGESLGTFSVEAKRARGGCGEAQTPPDPWKFEVRLSQEGRTLYWIQGGLPVHGTLDANNHTAMKSSDSRTLREGTTKPLRAACIVRREDALDTTLDATASPTKATLDVKSFRGSLSYRFVPEEGSDCQDMVENGSFDALPCEVGFDLSGSPKARRSGTDARR